MEEQDDNILLEILKLYQKKYGIVSEIFRLTQELSDMLSRNDDVSVQLVLNMRQEELDEASKCNRLIAVLEDAMPEELCMHYKAMLKEENGTDMVQTWEEGKILEVYRNTKEALRKAIELDKRVNLRVAGKDSFYAS